MAEEKLPYVKIHYQIWTAMEMSVKEWFRSSTIILYQERVAIMPNLDWGKIRKRAIKPSCSSALNVERELVRDCQYGNTENELLLDHLIFEVKDNKLKRRTIEEKWNLQKFLEVASRQPASSRPVCNFQSMKSPVELNSLLSKFFCYITYFVISPD